MCIHDGSSLDEEAPYRCCGVGCSACELVALFTERLYTSDFCVIRKDDYWNLGSYCSVTKCCHGAICFRCSFRDDIFCNFCQKWTTVDFLHKDSYGHFSLKTNSWSITNWFDVIVSFDKFKEKLGRKCQLFFGWLRNHCKRSLLDPQHLNSWNDLVNYRSDRIQVIMDEFEQFLLTIASKLVVSDSFFSNIHQIRVINPPFFEEINFKRQHLLRSFLEACYSRLPISRRQMMKETQVAIVGTLAVRLSHFQRIQKKIAKLIFSRIMLNLLLL